MNKVLQGLKWRQTRKGLQNSVIAITELIITKAKKEYPQKDNKLH